MKTFQIAVKIARIPDVPEYLSVEGGGRLPLDAFDHAALLEVADQWRVDLLKLADTLRRSKA